MKRCLSFTDFTIQRVVPEQILKSTGHKTVTRSGLKEHQITFNQATRK